MLHFIKPVGKAETGWGLGSSPRPSSAPEGQSGRATAQPATGQVLGSDDLTLALSEVLPPITSATETPGLISIQSASDLNLRVLESTTQTSELLGAPRQERSGDPFLTRSLWQWQAGPAGTTSQYLVGTCC